MDGGTHARLAAMAGLLGQGIAVPLSRLFPGLILSMISIGLVAFFFDRFLFSHDTLLGLAAIGFVLGPELSPVHPTKYCSGFRLRLSALGTGECLYERRNL